ncbi:MAG: sulfotransferase [Gammaproteobacteria bacterium]|nr:sulfotransferase [Gammaproteobacteria bacterium]NNJ84154.1 sulfotransferase [Gammaproteobacteria bacterium]
MTNRPLIILSPPRSFSSVVSTMLGQHPELYGFPELHLFVGDTVREVLDREYKHGNYGGPPGVLRTLAQLHDGVQTSATILRAIGWLIGHQDWGSKALLDYLLEKVAPRIGVEKSPVTCARPLWIERAYTSYPQAYYLHLTRHPVPTRQSMAEFFENNRRRKGRTSGRDDMMDRLMSWYIMHNNIASFTNGLPTGQTLRVRGEDILSEPDTYLPQICEWLGIRTDREAILAMKHPELSPYALPGPMPAPGGNDPKFMQSPALRVGRIREPSFDAFIESTQVQWLSEALREEFEEIGLSLATEREVADEVADFAHHLGYF